MPPVDVPSCIICDSPLSLARYCKTCLLATYCSLECLHTDLPAHELLCEQFKGFKKDNPRSEGGLLCIHFPVNETKPELVWLVYGSKLDEDGYYDFTQVDALLGGPSIPYFIRPSDFRRRKVKTQVVALHSLKDCRNKANNQCAAALTETYKGSHHAGPAIALSRTAGPSYEGVFQDITLSDFRVAVDYFIFTGTLMGLDAKCREKYEDKLATERMLHKSFVTKLVGGVKTNCRADEDLSGLGAFVPVNVQHDQPIYESKPTEMLFLMGHPLLFWQYPHKMSWNDGKSLQNHAVKTMGMSYSPAYANWAYHPTLDMSAGSWLVVREDGKDLTVTQLSVLLKYYEEVLLPKIKELPGSPFLKEWPHKEALQIREKWITRDVFEEYLQGYNTRRAAEDPNWVDVVSPCINLEAFPGSGVLKADK